MAQEAGDGRSMLRAGLALRVCGLEEPAARAFEQTLSMPAASPVTKERATVYLALDAYRKGALDKAREIVDRCFFPELSEDHRAVSLAELYILRAVIIGAQNVDHGADDFREVESMLNGAVALEPDNRTALYLLAMNRIAEARAEERKDRLSLALIGLDQALARYPSEPRFHYARALTTLTRGEQTAAFESVERALALDPDFFEALMLYGRMNLTIGDLKRAEESFQKACVLRPESYWAHYYLGESLKVAGSFDRASEQFVRAGELAPEQLVHVLGLALIEIDRPGVSWTGRCCDGRDKRAIPLLKQFIADAESAGPRQSRFLEEMTMLAKRRLDFIYRYGGCWIHEAEMEMAEMERMAAEQAKRETEMKRQMAEQQRVLDRLAPYPGIEDTDFDFIERELDAASGEGD